MKKMKMRKGKTDWQTLFIVAVVLILVGALAISAVLKNNAENSTVTSGDYGTWTIITYQRPFLVGDDEVVEISIRVDPVEDQEREANNRFEKSKEVIEQGEGKIHHTELIKEETTTKGAIIRQYRVYFQPNSTLEEVRPEATTRRLL